MIKLSLILPCYNVEKYIIECLDSLFTQNIVDNEYEVICVNDCSTDSTRDIIVEYQNKYRNLILIDHKTNKKQGAARNTGLQVAKGEYVGFIDPDDFIQLNVLGDLMDLIMTNNLDILQFNIAVTNDCLNGHIKFGDKKKSTEIISGKDYLESILDISWGFENEVWRRIYKRNLLISNSITFPEDISVGEDVLFVLKSLLFCNRFLHITDYIYIYRNDSIGSTMKDNVVGWSKISDRIDFSITCIDYLLTERGLDTKFVHQFVNFYLEKIYELNKVTLFYSNRDRIRFYLKIKPKVTHELIQIIDRRRGFMFHFPTIYFFITSIVMPPIRLLRTAKRRIFNKELFIQDDLR